MDKETKPIPVRINKTTRTRIRSAARKMNLPDSAVIRLGVMLILPQIEAGLIKVPHSGQ